MVDVKFGNAEEFISVMDIASNLVEEANLVFDGDGMWMRSMDPSRVALIDFSVPSSSFEVFKVESSDQEDEDDEVRLGLNMERFYKFLDRGDKSDSLRLKSTNNDSVLRITLDNDRREKSFRLPLRDLSGDEQEFPDLSHSVSACINAGIIQDALKDASLVGDALTFEATESDRVELRGVGGNQSTSAVIREGELLSDVSIDEDSVSTYGLSYLSSFFGGLSKSDEVSVGLGSDMPVLVSRDLYGGELRFVLAPRIDSDNE